MKKYTKKQLLKKIGKNCKKIRESRGYTQAKLAEKYNELFNEKATYKLFSHFENGNSDDLICMLLYFEISERQGMMQIMSDINLDLFNYIDWCDEQDPIFKFNPYEEYKVINEYDVFRLSENKEMNNE